LLSAQCNGSRHTEQGMHSSKNMKIRWFSMVLRDFVRFLQNPIFYQKLMYFTKNTKSWQKKPKKTWKVGKKNPKKHEKLAKKPKKSGRFRQILTQDPKKTQKRGVLAKKEDPSGWSKIEAKYIPQKTRIGQKGGA
jgi:hypothetical protein